MKVEQVFTHSVIATESTATIDEAADAMRKYHVGALLVMDGDGGEREAVGMVTDRDMVLQAVANGLSPQTVTVGDVMTPEIVTIDENADLRDALERMRNSAVRRLVVTRKNGEEIVGILSVDDVVDGLAAELSSLSGLMKSNLRRECSDYHHGHAI